MGVKNRDKKIINVGCQIRGDLQSLLEIIETTAKNGVVPVATSNVKLFLKYHMVRLKIISLYIYIYTDLRLKT